ncbi:MAG TPA: hypothetical protein VMW27_28205 [Thermoanaerobaculia bacterium]|nr:hypothetical protein [Thermoanaerobaculia bacterium]
MNKPEKQPTTKPGADKDPGKQDQGPKKPPKNPDTQKADGTPDWGVDPKTQQ